MGRAKHGKRLQDRLKAYHKSAAIRQVSSPFLCPVCNRRRLRVEELERNPTYITLRFSCICGLQEEFRMYNGNCFDPLDYYNYWLDADRKLDDEKTINLDEEKLKETITQHNWESGQPISMTSLKAVCGGSRSEIFERCSKLEGYVWIYGKGGEWWLSKEIKSQEVEEEEFKKSTRKMEGEPVTTEALLSNCLFKYSGGEAHLKLPDGQEKILSGKALRRLLRRLKLDPKIKKTMSEEELTRTVTEKLLGSTKRVEFTIVGDYIKNIKVVKRGE